MGVFGLRVIGFGGPSLTWFCTGWCWKPRYGSLKVWYEEA
jgi:hypothetical protein